VITFPLEEPGRPLVGDIYIGVDQARYQAAEHGVDMVEEIMRLAIHGTLHLLGWDHPEAGDRSGSPMYVRQEALLREVLATGRDRVPDEDSG
jgi:probable rRNA maturation factor